MMSLTVYERDIRKLRQIYLISQLRGKIWLNLLRNRRKPII